MFRSLSSQFVTVGLWAAIRIGSRVGVDIAEVAREINSLLVISVADAFSSPWETRANRVSPRVACRQSVMFLTLLRLLSANRWRDSGSAIGRDMFKKNSNTTRDYRSNDISTIARSIFSKTKIIPLRWFSENRLRVFFSLQGHSKVTEYLFFIRIWIIGYVLR